MIIGSISLSGDYRKIKAFLESNKSIKVTEINPDVCQEKAE